jgi:hypothetical protein
MVFIKNFQSITLKKMKKYFTKKNILLTLLVLFVLIQFVRPEKNQSNDFSKDISTIVPMSASLQQTLKTSCYDCHSNHTDYPWYAAVQPVAGWLQNHVEEGKGEINFSAFADYKLRRKYRKFQEIAEQVEEGEMPMSSYTLIHRNAALTETQKQEIILWAKAQMDTLKAHNPIDSLVKPK